MFCFYWPHKNEEPQPMLKKMGKDYKSEVINYYYCPFTTFSSFKLRALQPNINYP